VIKIIGKKLIVWDFSTYLILESHFDFSWNYGDKNYYFEEISKTDFRGGYSEKTRDDEKMFADLFNGKKLRI
ncbi:hypothetical protein, partial [Mesomycoplasma ovipneumoniae]